MDLDDFFERVDAHYKLALPFVIYRKPNTDEVITFLQNDNSLYFITDYTESGFVFAPFDDQEDTILIPLEYSETLSVIDTSNHRFPAEAEKPLGSAKLIHISKAKSSIVEDNSDKTCHINLVRKGIEAIKKGDLRKVVLSRKENMKLSDVNLLEIFKRLLKNYPSVFVYCFYHPKVGTWLGATPETLLKIEGHKFCTTALAGTQKYEGNLDVMWNPKEKEEQYMVTSFILDHLQPLVNQINVENVETAKAGSLLHLKSNISGTLDFDRLNLNQILNALHPTPAVCGVPKDKAKQFILENEQYSREFYTGFLGELNLKERKTRNLRRHNAENDAFAAIMTVTNLYVNLRCMQLKSEEAIIYVGGGITKDSNAEAEWDETVNKTQTIKSVL